MDAGYRAVTPAGLRNLVRKGINGAPLSASLNRKVAHTFLVRDGAAWSSFYFDNFLSAFAADEQKDLLHPRVVGSTGNAYAGVMGYWEKSAGDTLQRLLYTDIKTYLVELLMKQDQMSMAASVESRVPFLDHKLVEFASTVPAKYLIKGLSGKLILKSTAEDLLPRSVVYRSKIGFPTPWARWLSPQLDDIERTLLEPRALNRSLFRKAGIQTLFAEHRARRRDHGDRIWRLLNLELWHRIFMDGERSEAAEYRSFSGASHD